MSEQLPAYPVVPVHLADAYGLAACCGLPMPKAPENGYAPGTVLWTCTGCWGPTSWALRERDEPWTALKAKMMVHQDWWWELRWDPPFPGPEGYGIRVWRGTRNHAFEVAGAFGRTPHDAVRMLVGALP